MRLIDAETLVEYIKAWDRSQGRFEAFGKAIEIVGGGVNEKL